MRVWKACSIAALILLMASVSVAQSQLKKKTLVLNGQSGEVTFFEIDGHFYIDLTTLARIGNGSLAFDGNQIVLTLPSTAMPSAPVSQDSGAMSPEFMSAAVQELGQIKEWRSFTAYGLQNALPGTGARLLLLRDKASDGLRQATVAAYTPDDKQALKLLNTHYNNVLKWFNKVFDARKNMAAANYSMNPDALAQDPQFQTLVRCHDFLSSMVPSGTYSDDGSCPALN